MSKGDKVPNDVKSFLRSVLISSNGVKESKVQKDYHELSGERLMWKDYGFKSLNEFLTALPDVCLLEYSAKDKENRVYAVRLEGTYMSSHAKKNAKTASTTISPTKQQNVPENGRLVERDGETFKITLTNIPQVNEHGGGSDDLKPNNNGLYQVYVIKLPESCSKVKYKHIPKSLRFILAVCLLFFYCLIALLKNVIILLWLLCHANRNAVFRTWISFNESISQKCK